MLIPISQFPNRPSAPVTNMNPPALDLLERDDYYLLSIDLPGLSEKGTEITLGKNSLEVLTDKGGPASEILFRCKSLSGAVRAVYYEGALWLMLPKSGRQACAALGA